MQLYFRIKDNGAVAFRLEEDASRGRLDMRPIADVNVRNGQTKPRRDAEITKAEQAEIEVWIENRRAALARHEADAPRRAIEALNEAAQWYGGKPDPKAAEATRDDLLMAMHDLRATIVRHMADQADAKG